MASYVIALQAHDWNSEFTSDQRAWRAGRESLTALRTAQQLIDPQFVVWNTWAPESHHVHIVPGVKP